MKIINCKNNNIITVTLEYTSIDDTCKKLKKTIENNYTYGMHIVLKNESEYEFMKLFMNVGLYYHYAMFILDAVEDALLTYEVNNYMALHIANEEVHDNISHLIWQLEKLARTHNMWDDLKTSSIYRMLSYAQWEYENREDGE